MFKLYQKVYEWFALLLGVSRRQIVPYLGNSMYHAEYADKGLLSRKIHWLRRTTGWSIGPLFGGCQAYEVQILWLVFQLFYKEPSEDAKSRGFYFTSRFGVWIDTAWSMDKGFRKLKPVRWLRRAIY